jgi:hypothetical protein
VGTEIRVLRSTNAAELEEMIQHCVTTLENNGKRLRSVQFSIAEGTTVTTYAALLWFEYKEY